MAARAASRRTSSFFGALGDCKGRLWLHELHLVYFLPFNRSIALKKQPATKAIGYDYQRNKQDELMVL